MRLIAGGGGAAGERHSPWGGNKGCCCLRGDRIRKPWLWEEPPGPARGKPVELRGGSGGREPGPPLSGVAGGTRQGGRAEGRPWDTVWNIWGLAPSPAINEKQASTCGSPSRNFVFSILPPANSQLPCASFHQAVPHSTTLLALSQTSSHHPSSRPLSFPVSVKWRTLTRRRV